MQTSGARFRIFHNSFSNGEYKFQFEVFEGPLDLLFSHPKRRRWNIYEVNSRARHAVIEYI